MTQVPGPQDEPVPELRKLRQRSPRLYKKHGFHNLRKKVKVQGLAAIDQRTLGGRELLAWTQNLISHLGGADEISHVEETIAKRSAVLEVLLRQAEVDLLTRGILVNGRGGRSRHRIPHPLLPFYRSLVQQQTQMLSLLGMKRRPKKILSLEDYVSTKYGPEKSKAKLNRMV
jgi:hypothetical protein